MNELDSLRREIRYLRHYGNADCTAMADEAMEKGELEEATVLQPQGQLVEKVTQASVPFAEAVKKLIEKRGEPCSTTPPN